MSDLISRQAAIDKIDSLYRDTAKNESYMITGYNHAVSDALAITKSLPSAQPKQNDCESCRYNAYEWDEEPCDSCTGAGSHWKPSAQPEITHCRDCKWHNGEINQRNAQICASMCGEDFCSRAERREG